MRNFQHTLGNVYSMTMLFFMLVTYPIYQHNEKLATSVAGVGVGSREPTRDLPGDTAPPRP